MRAFLLLLPLLYLLPAGCAGIPVSNSYADSTYDSVTTLAGPAKQGELPLLLLGGAFDRPSEALAGTIAEIMTRAHRGPSFKVVPRSDVELSRGYVVVMLLQPAPGASGYALCREPRQPTAPDPERLNLLAAFCEVGDTMTYSRAWISTPQGPEDPKFAALIRQVTQELFPPKRGDQNFADRDGATWVD